MSMPFGFESCCRLYRMQRRRLRHVGARVEAEPSHASVFIFDRKDSLHELTFVCDRASVAESARQRVVGKRTRHQRGAAAMQPANEDVASLRIRNRHGL